MYEELTSDEQEKVELKEFLKELVNTINDRFDRQKAIEEEFKMNVTRTLERELEQLREGLEMIKNALTLIEDKLDDNKIMVRRDIIDKLKC